MTRGYVILGVAVAIIVATVARKRAEFEEQPQ